jgi:hypothetical protein
MELVEEIVGGRLATRNTVVERREIFRFVLSGRIDSLAAGEPGAGERQTIARKIAQTPPPDCRFEALARHVVA